MDDSLNNVFVKALCTFDQQVQEVRLLYLELSKAEQLELRTWLTSLTALCHQGVPWLPMRVLIHTRNELHDSDGKAGYEGNASLTPKAMLRAVEAWDRGEEFSPKNAFI